MVHSCVVWIKYSKDSLDSNFVIMLQCLRELDIVILVFPKLYCPYGSLGELVKMLLWIQ